jgi:hypothetical protein
MCLCSEARNHTERLDVQDLARPAHDIFIKIAYLRTSHIGQTAKPLTTRIT